MNWLTPHSPLPEIDIGEFIRLMRDEFAIYVIPWKGPGTGVRFVESPFKPEAGKSIYVIPDNRSGTISHKTIMAVLSRFNIQDKFRDAYNHYFKLSPPSGEL